MLQSLIKLQIVFAKSKRAGVSGIVIDNMEDLGCVSGSTITDGQSKAREIVVESPSSDWDFLREGSQASLGCVGRGGEMLDFAYRYQASNPGGSPHL